MRIPRSRSILLLASTAALLTGCAGTAPTTPAPAPAAPASAYPAPDVQVTTIEQGRERIDQLDQAVVDLVRQRNEVSAQVQRIRLTKGGARVDPGREQQIVERYRGAFGEPGVAMAQAILKSARG